MRLPARCGAIRPSSCASFTTSFPAPRRYLHFAPQPSANLHRIFDSFSLVNTPSSMPARPPSIIQIRLMSEHFPRALPPGVGGVSAPHQRHNPALPCELPVACLFPNVLQINLNCKPPCPRNRGLKCQRGLEVLSSRAAVSGETFARRVLLLCRSAKIRPSGPSLVARTSASVHQPIHAVF